MVVKGFGVFLLCCYAVAMVFRILEHCNHVARIFCVVAEAIPAGCCWVVPGC